MNPDPGLDLDLRDLHLIRLVAKHGRITAAAAEAGMSQSTLTRQIQTLEARLGFMLFHRTTRSVSLTRACAMLLEETQQLPGILENAKRRLREEVFGVSPEIRVGLSRSVSLAHLSGLLHGQVRHHPQVKTLVSIHAASSLVEAVSGGKLDVAVLSPPPRLPDSVTVLRRIEDHFIAIAPAEMEVPDPVKQTAEWRAWVQEKAWIVPPAGTRSRTVVDEGWKRQKITAPASMEIEGFDATIHLVALGLGCACVPRRAVASFPRKKRLQRIRLPVPVMRELVLLVPKRTAIPGYVREFVDSILF